MFVTLVVVFIFGLSQVSARNNAPTNVSRSSTSATSITVQWSTMDMGAVLGFMLTYNPVNGSCVNVKGGTKIVMGNQIYEYVLEGLEESVNYTISVQTKGTEGYGLASTAIFVTTLPAAPASPVIVSAMNTLPPPFPSTSFLHSFNVSWRELECIGINDVKVDMYKIRYGPIDGSSRTMNIGAPSTSLTITNSGFSTLTAYSFEVAAINSVGLGAYSLPLEAAILEAPGPITNLMASPDIISLLVMWEPPANEGSRRYLTEYEIIYYLFMNGNNLLGNLLGSAKVARNGTSHRISGLLPNVFYVIKVQGLVGDFRGTNTTIVLSTLKIGQVFGVIASMQSSTSVNVSWTKLDSNDISSYLVYYSGVVGKRRRQNGEERAVYPGDVSWGVVKGLQAGREYSFQVTAVVLVGGLEREGQQRSAIGLNSVITLEATGGGGSAAAIIAGVVIAVLVVCACLAICLVLIIKLWLRRKDTGDTFVIKRKTYDPQPDRPYSTMMAPLSDFESFSRASKPVIHLFPKDTMVLEGELVTFKPTVMGTPIPTVAWYFDGCMVTSDYATEVLDDGTLTFFCVERKHMGTYRFTVSNNAGSIQGQVYLKVCSEEDQMDVIPKDILESNSVSVEEFGVYVKDLHKSNNGGFREQFSRLPSGEEGQSLKWGEHPENRHRNRFTNIVVYDENRVNLKPIGGAQDSLHSYVNASYINGYFMSRKFVATQGPTKSTVVDFWRLVWQLRAPTIVMITNLEEEGRVKCTKYWPESTEEDFGPFKVVMSEEKVYNHFTIRCFYVKLPLREQSALKVVQYHFTAWPDHGIPEHVAPMLAFHRRVKAEHLSMLGPILLHCSAGVGRTGTYISLDIALQQASGEDHVDIPAIVGNLRKQRMKMVQTEDQFMFIHDAVLESLVCGNTQIQVHDLQQTVESLRSWEPKTERTGFQTQFHTLNQLSPNPDEVMCAVAQNNMDRNRHASFLPSDRHRVILRAERPDYINATFIHGHMNRKKFIITQGPLTNTSRDFWKMVYERNVAAIVMLSGTVENEEEVCHKYWPSSGIQSYGEYDISLLEHTMHDGYSERIYSITDSKSGQAHRVTQFQVLNWHYQGINLNSMSVISVINTTSTFQKTRHLGPIVVHCSDKVTRSAMFCAISNAIEYCKTEEMVDIFQVVKVLRSQLPGAIPTEELYQVIHELVLKYTQNTSLC